MSKEKCTTFSDFQGFLTTLINNYLGRCVAYILSYVS